MKIERINASEPKFPLTGGSPRPRFLCRVIETGISNRKKEWDCYESADHEYIYIQAPLEFHRCRIKLVALRSLGNGRRTIYYYVYDRFLVDPSVSPKARKAF